MKFLTLLILTIYFNPVFANAKKHSIDDDIKAVLKTKRFELKKTDVFLAENLVSLLKVINSGYFNEGMINKTFNAVSSNSNFSPFLPWLTDIKKMMGQKSADQLAAFCQEISDQAAHSSLDKVLLDSKQKACVTQFTTVQLKNIDPKGLSEKSYNYISKNVRLFCEPENIENTAYLFTLLKEKSQYDYLRLSDLFSEYFMFKKEVPPSKLLGILAISSDLTQFIQRYGFDQDNSQVVFYKELETMADKIYNGTSSQMEKDLMLTYTRQLVNFYDLNLPYLPENRTLKKMMNVGKQLSRRQYYNSASLVFNSLIKSEAVKEEASFEYLWIYVDQKKYKEALKEANRLKLLDNLAQLKDSRLMFWLGNILLENNDTRSKLIFEQIIAQDPLSFYAVMSAKSLQDKYQMSPDKIFAGYLEANQIQHTFTLQDMTDDAQKSLFRLKAWNKISSNLFIGLESEDFISIHSGNFTIKETDKRKAIATLLVSEVFNENSNYLAAFKQIYAGLNQNNVNLNFTVLNNLFPRPFFDEIKKLTKSFDPIIALSLIRQESVFNPKARSIVGARGLMQIMPATAKQIRSRINPKQLENPNVNLQIGTTYFNRLLNKYDQNLVLTLAAYNAGEGRVKFWKDQYFTDDSILTNIEKIPFDETRNYVKLIFRNIFFYKLISGENKVADTTDVNKIFGIHLGFNK